MTDPRIVRAMIVGFIVYMIVMSIWRFFIMPDMSWLVIVGAGVVLTFYLGYLKRRQG